MEAIRSIIAFVLILACTEVQSKKVCIVKDKKDADISVNITRNRAIADYVVVISKEKYKSGSNIWIITAPEEAELKVFYSKLPEKIKVFISKNETDKLRASNHKKNSDVLKYK